MKKTTKLERVEIVNQLIQEIASRGRKFFHYEGEIAELFIKNNRLYYKCEYQPQRKNKVITEMCLSIPDYRRPKYWYHGGTLLGLVRDFKKYINTGKYSNSDHGYGGLYCSHWGYPESDMIAIQEKGVELGYLRPSLQI